MEKQGLSLICTEGSEMSEWMRSKSHRHNANNPAPELFLYYRIFNMLEWSKLNPKYHIDIIQIQLKSPSPQ